MACRNTSWDLESRRIKSSHVLSFAGIHASLTQNEDICWRLSSHYSILLSVLPSGTLQSGGSGGKRDETVKQNTEGEHLEAGKEARAPLMTPYFPFGSATEWLLQLVWDAAVPVRWGRPSVGSYCSFNRPLYANMRTTARTQWDLVKWTNSVQLRRGGVPKDWKWAKWRFGLIYFLLHSFFMYFFLFLLGFNSVLFICSSFSFLSQTELY